MRKFIDITLSDGSTTTLCDVTRVDLKSDTFILINYKNEKGKNAASLYSTEIAAVESIPYVTEMTIKLA